MKPDTYDVVVVGATRAGIAAAEAALERDLSVAVVDGFQDALAHEKLWSELLLQTSVLRDGLADMANSGRLYREAVRQTWRDLRSPRRAGFEGLQAGFETRCPRFTTLEGPARFLTPSRIKLGCGTELEASTFVIAVGASPRRPTRFHFDGQMICDAHQFIHAIEPPRSVTIVGADWLGCEWAFVCASAGVKVTLLDRRSRLLRALDADVRLAVQSALHDMGVEIVLNEELASVEEGPHGECRIQLSSGREEVCERLLILAGQHGNCDQLGLAELGVSMDSRHHIMVDDSFQSSVSGIFSIGAASDPMGLAPSASLQAELVLAAATGETPTAASLTFPWVLHSAVEVAMCGLTEEACKTLDVEVVVGRAASGKLDHCPSRLAKGVVDCDRGRLLGVQLAGPGAAEAICLASNWIDRDGHIEEGNRIGGSENTMTELCCRALRSAATAWQRDGRSSPDRSQGNSRLKLG